MPSGLEIVGIEAIVAGINAFERDANNVNRLLAQIDRTTSDLGRNSTSAWGLVKTASDTALFGIATGASLAISALAGITAGTVSMAASFESNLIKAGSALNLTRQETDSLGNTILNVGATSNIAISQISEAANSLARSGIGLKAIQSDVLEATVRLSEASGGELGLADSAKLVSVAMNAWELSAKDVTVVTSALLAAANASAIGFGDLSTAFQLTAPLAASLHIPFADLSATLAVLGEAGIKGTVAGTALKTMLERLANPTALGAELMRKYQISIQDAAGKIVPLPEIIRRLEAAFGDAAIAEGKLTEADRAQVSAALFGTRSVLDALALANKGTEAYQALTDAIANTNVAARATEIKDSLIPQLAELRNQFDVFITRVGIPLEQALSGGVKQINNLLRTLDPRIPQAFADALLLIFSGSSKGNIGTELSSVFGEKLGGNIESIIGVALALRDAVTKELIPAFRILFTTITGGVDVGEGFTKVMDKVSTVIRDVSTYIARAVATFATLISTLRETAGNSEVLSTILKALVLAPFVGLAISLLRVVASISLITLGLTALSLGLAYLPGLIKQIPDIATKAFNDIRQAISNVTPEVKLLGEVLLTGLALVLTGAVLVAFRNAKAEIIAFKLLMKATYAQSFIKEVFDATVEVSKFTINLLRAGIALVVNFAIDVELAAVKLLSFLIPALIRSVIAIGQFTISVIASGISVVSSLAGQAAAAVSSAASTVASGASSSAAYAATGAAGAASAATQAAASAASAGATAAGAATIITALETLKVIYIKFGTDVAIINTAIVVSFEEVVVGYLTGSALMIEASSISRAVIVANNLAIVASNTAVALSEEAVAASYVVSAPLQIAAAASMARSAGVASSAFVESGTIIEGSFTTLGLAVRNVGFIMVPGAVTSLLAALGPLLVGLAVVTLAAAALYLAWTNDWFGIREAVQTAVGTLTPIVNTLASVLGTVLLVALGLVIVEVRGFIGTINDVISVGRAFIGTVESIAVSLSKLPAVIGAAVASVSTFAVNLITSISQIQIGATTFGSVWNTVWTGVGGVVDSIVRFIVNALITLFDTLRQIPVVGAALDQLGSNFNFLRDTGTKAVNDLTSAFNTAKNFVVNSVDTQRASFDVLASTVKTDAQVMIDAFLRYVGIVINGVGSIDRVLADNVYSWQLWATDVGYALDSFPKTGGPGTEHIPGPPLPPIPSFGSPTHLEAPSAGAKAAKPSVDELTTAYAKLLAGIRGNVQELARFLAQLEQANPGRIDGMIAALQNMKGVISDIADEYQRVQGIALAIAAVQQDINVQTASINLNNLQRDQAEFGLKAQLIGLDQQRLAIEAQMLPIKQQMADLDNQLTKAQRPNYQNALDTAKLLQQELPLKQQIAALDRQINDVEDQRVTLLLRQQEIQSQQSLDALNNQLTSVNNQLNKAWQTLNVPQILALEKQKNALADSVASAQNSLTAVQDEQKTTQENNELAQINLKLQKLGLEDLLKPFDDQLTLLQEQNDSYNANQAVIVASLELQKAGLVDLLEPMQFQLDAINAQVAAINAQIAAIDNLFALNAQQFEAKKLQDEIELASLQILKAQEDARFQQLLLDYANALAASGAFTESESLETIKRLGFWNTSADAVAAIVTQFTDLQAAANAANEAISRIPSEVRVRISFETDQIPSFQYGGVVGGPVGSPQLIIAHGGERFLGTQNSSPTYSKVPQARGGSGATVTNNYNVNANYSNKQSPTNIGMDLRALIAMSKR